MRRCSSLLFICLVLIFGASNQVLAFPEMIRKDYVNCTSCHVSPTGGGVLMPYGRVLSQEVLSRWSADENESQFAYVYTPPESVFLGGDVRWIQTYRDSKVRRTLNYFWMQADFEAAVRVKKISVLGNVGVKEGSGIHSRRHYVMYQPDEEYFLRLGRFMPAFGINTQDHILVTKQGLGLDQGTETYNLETAWVGENANHFITLVGGNPSGVGGRKEQGLAIQSSFFLAEKHKVGLSYFYGTEPTSKRHLGGPFGIFSLTPQLVLLSEWDLQHKTLSGSPSTFGFVHYHKLDYEITQGVHGFLIQEFSKLNLSSSDAAKQVYGIGIQFFPRPHLDLIAQIQKQSSSAATGSFEDFGWFVLHFYL